MTIDDWLALIVRSLPATALVVRGRRTIRIRVLSHRLLITIQQEV